MGDTIGIDMRFLYVLRSYILGHVEVVADAMEDAEDWLRNGGGASECPVQGFSVHGGSSLRPRWSYRGAALSLRLHLGYNVGVLEKGKPAARRGRKATGLLANLGRQPGRRRSDDD